MKRVTIKQMDLHYFKGARNKSVTFGDQETIISGPNGCGKTTIVDAFFWCLWGKNSIGQSDQKFLIKTVDAEGNEIPHVDHEVQVTILVDEALQTFRRVLTPKYDQDDNLKGNTTAYYWNDVPLKQSEYNAKVSEVISEDVFKLITSPYTFLQLPWEKQREMLMNMAGEISDAEVAGESPEMRQLLLDMTGKSLEEYKREINAKLKKVNEEMSSIPARIDEVHRAMPESPDMDALQAEEDALAKELNEITDAHKSEMEVYNAANAEKANLSKLISDLTLKQQQILQERQSQERNAIHEANAKYNEAEQALKFISTEETTDRNNCERQQATIDMGLRSTRRAIEAYDAKLERLRAEWMDCNAQTFQAEEYLKCPLYGHLCGDGHACSKYDQNQGEAFVKFSEERAKRMADIAAQGKDINVKKAELVEQVKDGQKKFNEIQEGYVKRKADRDDIMKRHSEVMATFPKRALISTIKAEDIEECIEIGKQIEALSRRAAEIQEVHPLVDSSYDARKDELLSKIKQIGLKKSSRITISQLEERIQVLENEMAELGEQKAELEYKRSNIAAFEIAKTELVGSRVNQRFHLVTWQMFMRQVNGEEIPACICMLNGVRYNDVNDAGKLNAGIDVASALSEAFQVSAPMFIDGAEKSLHIYNPGTAQQIILKVEDRKEINLLTK